MLQPEKIFGNLFDDEMITDTRLANFMSDHINRLNAQNGTNGFAALLALLKPPYADLQAEVDDVDSAVGVQKGKTLTVDQLVESFKKTMSQKAGVIADVFGGTNTPGYIEFYPAGVTEYGRATKTQLPTLVSRINTAATAHAATLGATLTATLQGFATSWKATRNAQQEQKGTVSENRADRTTARAAAEIALVVSIHTIATMYPGNVDQCNSFYNFSLLFATAAHKSAVSTSGVVKPGGLLAVLNKSFTSGTRFRIFNTSVNASMFVYTSATSNGEMSGKGIEVKAGKSVNVTAEELGSLDNTFLIIKNLSDVNDVYYVVELR